MVWKGDGMPSCGEYLLPHARFMYTNIRSNHTKKMRRVFFQKKMKRHLSPISIIQLFKISSNAICASHRRIDHSKEGCNRLKTVIFCSILSNNASHVKKSVPLLRHSYDLLKYFNKYIYISKIWMYYYIN